MGGRPFLEYEVALLRERGVRDLVLCVGYLGEAIEEHFGDGSRFGVRMEYVRDGPRLLGPSGALRGAASKLGDSFLVTYGDAYLRMDYRGVMRRLLETDALGVMAAYRNDGRHGRSDLVVSGGRVVAYDKTRHLPGMSWINFGVTALRKEALSQVPRGTPCDEETFYRKLIQRGALLSYQVRNRFYEIGTPRSLQEFRAFIGGRARERTFQPA